MILRAVPPPLALGALTVLAGCGGTETAPLPEAPDVFEVGVTTLDFVDETRDDLNRNLRALRVEVWYPAIERARVYERDAFDMVEEAPEDLIETVCAIDLPHMVQDAARDAPVEDRFGPYPLLMFSHGKNGIRVQTHTLMTHLASRGYVVAAVDHTDDTLWEMIRDPDIDPGSVILSLVDRPQDISFVADQLFTNTELSPLIAPDRYGMFGHSFGGVVSVMISSSAPVCEFYDERVAAIMPLAPITTYLVATGCSIEDSEVPKLLLGGKLDVTTPYEPEQTWGYEASSEPKGLVGIHEAGHFSFTELCDLDLAGAADQLGIDAGNVLNDGCGPTFIAPEAQQNLQNYFGENFFDAFMRDDAAARANLAPENVPAEILALTDYVEVGLAP